jgi:polyphosphate kinase
MAAAPQTGKLEQDSAVSGPVDPALYVNRELSLLEFQRRVLGEAQDPRLPVLERLKFLAIVSSNLNEFFMVRVAGLLDQVAAGVWDTNYGEIPPADQLRQIRKEIRLLLGQSRTCLQKSVLPALQKEGTQILPYRLLSDDQKEVANGYFAEHVFPVLTPLAFDPSRPFPHISNLSLNLAVVIRHPDQSERFARVKVPDTLPQLVRVGPRAAKPACYLWLEELISANLEMLFPGTTVIEAHPFHVTRNADIAIQELEADDLLEVVAEGVRQRRFGSVVRLVVHDEMPEKILTILKNNLEIHANGIYRVNGPLALNRLMSLYGIDRPELKNAPIKPRIPSAFDAGDSGENFFAAIARQDVLLHHPYDSFKPVVEFLRQAACDPHVLAIKMTLYRVGKNSPVVEALLEAMQNGKQVAVLVELKARFDEESNISWARALEEEGVHVVYGLVGLKIHSKIALVVRQEGDQVRRYIHLSTGNYNSVTANLYTDLGYFTCDKDLAGDATQLFNYLTGYAAEHNYKKLLVAPVGLRERIETMIEREISVQESGGEGRLIFKTNGLADRKMIDLLYKASQAGVRCDLLVRGVCRLRPGVEGLSESIRVISVVGRFLEHSRAYYFHNGGQPDLYLGSADLMRRNLSSRVETLFPITRPDLIRYVRDEILETALADNQKAHIMQPHGGYARVIPLPGDLLVDSQALMARGRATTD